MHWYSLHYILDIDSFADCLGRRMPYYVVGFALSAAALVVLVIAQARLQHPMFDLSLLCSRPFISALIARFVLTTGTTRHI